MPGTVRTRISRVVRSRGQLHLIVPPSPWALISYTLPKVEPTVTLNILSRPCPFSEFPWAGCSLVRHCESGVLANMAIGGEGRALYFHSASQPQVPLVPTLGVLSSSLRLLPLKQLPSLVTRRLVWSVDGACRSWNLARGCTLGPEGSEKKRRWAWFYRTGVGSRRGGAGNRRGHLTATRGWCPWDLLVWTGLRSKQRQFLPSQTPGVLQPECSSSPRTFPNWKKKKSVEKYSKSDSTFPVSDSSVWLHD